MIVEWFMGVGVAIVEWMTGIFPVWEPPEQLLNADQMLNDLFASLDGFGPWVDWQYVGIVAGIPIAVWSIGLLIKLARAALAHLPWIGGKG